RAETTFLPNALAARASAPACTSAFTSPRGGLAKPFPVGPGQNLALVLPTVRLIRGVQPGAVALGAAVVGTARAVARHLDRAIRIAHAAAAVADGVGVDEGAAGPAVGRRQAM